jgi:hypothetical protein
VPFIAGNSEGTVLVKVTLARSSLYFPLPSGVRVRKPNFPLGFNEGPLIILLTLTPKLLEVAVAGSVTTTVLLVRVQVTEIFVVASLQVELLRGEIYAGKIISKNDDDANVDCCDRVNVYSVVALLTLDTADIAALVKIAGIVIVMLSPVESCSIR